MLKQLKSLARQHAPERLIHLYQDLFIRVPVTHKGNGFCTQLSAHLLDAEPFAGAYRQALQEGCWGTQVISKTPHWRAFVCTWAASHGVLMGPGDLIEFGVWKGGISSVVMKCLDFAKHTDRSFFLLDTFDGVEGASGAEIRNNGRLLEARYYRNTHTEVVKRFAPYPNARIIKGAVPQMLNQVQSERICYVSIDMNAREPEIAAAEYVWPRMIPGAVMVLDDYGFPRHNVQRDGFDDFAHEHGVPVLLLPTGQGIIMKPA